MFVQLNLFSQDLAQPFPIVQFLVSELTYKVGRWYHWGSPFSLPKWFGALLELDFFQSSNSLLIQCIANSALSTICICRRWGLSTPPKFGIFSTIASVGNRYRPPLKLRDMITYWIKERHVDHLRKLERLKTISRACMQQHRDDGTFYDLEFLRWGWRRLYHLRTEGLGLILLIILRLEVFQLET